jgi:aarF domain-containing kinase
MSDRASALAQLARGALGVALSAAATRGPLASKEMASLAEMVLTGGVARRAAPGAAALKAAEETRRAPPAASVPRDSVESRPEAVSFVSDAMTETRDAKTARESADHPRSRMAPASTAANANANEDDGSSANIHKTKVRRREVAVPSSPIARVMGFGQLAAGLAAGTVAESARRVWRGAKVRNAAAANSRTESKAESRASPSPADAPNASLHSSDESGFAPPLVGDSVFLTEANAERLAVALCRMRGAALKLGQMLSIQDESVVPPAIARALERVREGADVMPAGQLMGAVEAHLGKDWRAPNGSIENGGNVEVLAFSDEPLAAASIGQVHRATVRRALEDGSGKFENLEVCMKIQYPGVARSIHSDIDNLVRLVSMTDLIPRGLYVEHAVATAKEELTLECDYEYELASQEKMRALLADDPAWTTPRTIPELSSAGVLTTTFAPGVAIDKVASLSQAERDYVATQLLRATLRELFEFRFMQSDPNFANFLYCRETRALTMIDFGAAKAYPKPFVDEYLRMVVACAERDREGVIDASIKLGFLTGEEAAVLVDAHVEAGFQVGRPFQASTRTVSDPNENANEIMYDFGENRDMTRRVAGLGKVMLKHRLTPPPAEAYSLHRKLSGSFLACMRLRARVPARALLMEAYRKYDFTNERAAETDEGENDTATLRSAVA